METEHFFTCPHCGDGISVLVDTSQEHQSYIEDCETCCRPIRLTIESREGEIVGFTAES